MSEQANTEYEQDNDLICPYAQNMYFISSCQKTSFNESLLVLILEGISKYSLKSQVSQHPILIDLLGEDDKYVHSVASGMCKLRSLPVYSASVWLL